VSFGVRKALLLLPTFLERLAAYCNYCISVNLYDPGGHLSEDTAEMYAVGRLTEPVLADVEEHLLICARCRRSVEVELRFSADIKTALIRLTVR
jgi:hypothetical protein